MVIRGQTVVRNTVATTSGTVNPAAILGVDGHFDLLNVTAWSTSASSTGIAIRSNTEATSATIRNTIAYGVTDQLSSSPTIDAGTASGVPAIDYDGDLRDVGADPDIGADEPTPAPYASTLDAVDVGATVARIRGSIGPAGSIASWRFNWGKTLAYELTPFQIFPSYVGPDIFGHIVDLKLTNLQPSTTYHFRVRAANATGSGIGSDKTFTTGAPNTPDPGRLRPRPGNRRR